MLRQRRSTSWWRPRRLLQTPGVASDRAAALSGPTSRGAPLTRLSTAAAGRLLRPISCEVAPMPGQRSAGRLGEAARPNAAAGLDVGGRVAARLTRIAPWVTSPTGGRDAATCGDVLLESIHLDRAREKACERAPRGAHAQGRRGRTPPPPPRCGGRHAGGASAGARVRPLSPPSPDYPSHR
jgi:hypothetical protein